MIKVTKAKNAADIDVIFGPGSHCMPSLKRWFSSACAIPAMALHRPDGWSPGCEGCQGYLCLMRKTNDTLKAKGHNFCRSLGCKSAKSQLSFQQEIISIAGIHQIVPLCRKYVTNTLKLSLFFRFSKFWSLHFHILRGKCVPGSLCDSFKCMVQPTIAEGLPKISMSVSLVCFFCWAIFWAKQNFGQGRLDKDNHVLPSQHHVFLTNQS